MLRWLLDGQVPSFEVADVFQIVDVVRTDDVASMPATCHVQYRQPQFPSQQSPLLN